MAATLGRIVLIVTGGYAGSALYSYQDAFPQVFGSTLRDFANLFKISNSGGTSSGLEKQVEMLSHDMRALMLSGRGGTIVLSNPQGSAFSKVEIQCTLFATNWARCFGTAPETTDICICSIQIVMILVPGAGVYLYYKGYRISDFFWVSATSFQQTVDSLRSGQLGLDKCDPYHSFLCEIR